MTGAPSTSTTTTSDESTSTESTAACEPQVFSDIAVPPHPVNLLMLVLPDADETRFERVTPGLLDFLLGADGEDMRFVFADDGLATPPVSAKHLCTSCKQSCGSAYRYIAQPPVFNDFLSAALNKQFECVLHPDMVMPRGRLLVVAGPLASDLGDTEVSTLDLLLSQSEADGDLLCSGCTLGGPSMAEMLFTNRGGYVADLDDPEQVAQALLRAGIAPSWCAWPLEEDVPPPLSSADMTVRIDPCVDESCAVDLEQVTGAGACDGDPVIPQFYVVPDQVAPGVSAVVLCPDACQTYRRAAHMFTRVDHIYNCPE